MCPQRRQGRSGGSGTAGGIDFQARLGAWFCCAILAATDVPPLWGWPECETFESVFAETDEATDDLFVTNSRGARAYIQAKSRLDLATGANTPLGSTVSQFVGQLLRAGPDLNLDDRFVLATGPSTSNAVATVLPRILRRVSSLREDQPASTAARSKEERNVLAVVMSHIDRGFVAHVGRAPTEKELKTLLIHTRVSVHDLDDDGVQAREAQSLLRTSVLEDPFQAGLVWREMVSRGLRLSVDQSGVTRSLLQGELSRLGVALKTATTYGAVRHEVPRADTSAMNTYLENLVLFCTQVPEYWRAGRLERHRIRQSVRVRAYARKVGVDPAISKDAWPLMRDNERFTAGQEWHAVAGDLGRAVLLGGPGSGKSWLLQRHGHDVATKALADLRAARRPVEVPLLVHAADVGSLAPRRGVELRAALIAMGACAHGPTESTAQALVRDLSRNSPTPLVVLIDGLDEVTPDLRVNVLSRLAALDQLEGIRMIVASRFAGYSGLPFAGVDSVPVELEMLSLAFDQFEAIAHAWYSERPHVADRLITLARSSSELDALCRIPLLATFLCLSAAQEPEPTTRLELYERTVRRLVSAQWSTSARVAGDSHVEDERVALAQAIAAQLARDPAGWRDRATRGELSALAGPDARGRLDEISALLPSRDRPVPGAAAERTLAFLHRSLQEYLVAAEIARSPAAEQLIAERVRGHPEWADTLRMAIALAPVTVAEAVIGPIERRLGDPRQAWRWRDTAFESCLDLGHLLGDLPDGSSIVTKRRLALVALPLFAGVGDIRHRARYRIRRFTDRRLPQLLATLLRHYDRRMPSEEYAVLKKAIEALRDTQEPTAVRALSKLVEDPESTARIDAALALYGSTNPDALCALTTAMNEQLHVERRVAMEALGYSAEGTDIVLRRLADPRWDGRVDAVEVLGNVSRTVPTEHYVALLRDPDGKVRAAAAKALARSSQGPLWAAMTDDDARLRQLAVEMLAASAEVAILEVAEDPVASVRAAVAKALAPRNGEPAVRDALLALARDTDASVRCRAAEALNGQQGGEVSRVLLERLHDEDAAIRAAAARSIRDADNAVTAALLVMVKGEDASARDAAAEALRFARGPEAVAALTELLHRDGFEFGPALRGLARMRDPEATRALFCALTTERWNKRMSIVSELPACPDLRWVDVVIGRLRDDEEWDVRRAAVHALAHVMNDNAAARQALLAALDDPESKVREAAAGSLRYCRDAGVHDALIKRLLAGGRDVARIAYDLPDAAIPRVAMTMVGWIGHVRADKHRAAVRLLSATRDVEIAVYTARKLASLTILHRRRIFADDWPYGEQDLYCRVRDLARAANKPVPRANLIESAILQTIPAATRAHLWAQGA